MSEAIQLDDPINATSDSYRARRVARKSGGNGDDMDDILKRLGAVESSVSELKVQVSGIAATIPYLATKDDLREVRGEVAAIAARIPHLATNDGLAEVRAVIPHLATRADVKDGIGCLRAEIGSVRAEMRTEISSVRAEMGAMETRIIKWMITTVLTAVGLAFTIAKFVH
ncbi:MAG TPA: hypothetical protein VI653_23965 [Steroidobacteraceae bacterium]